MERLYIEPHQDSLKVMCDPDQGIIDLVGSSYPEDAVDFFKPIYLWIKDYIDQIKKNIIINFKIDYINSSSTKCIFDLLEMLEDYYKNGGNTQIYWYYKKNDLDMEETGEEFKKYLEIPFEIKPF